MYVFDVAVTEGAPLPELSAEVTGEVGEYHERLLDFIVAQRIALEFKENIAPALGVSYGGKIVLLPGQTSAEEFSTPSTSTTLVELRPSLASLYYFVQKPL